MIGCWGNRLSSKDGSGIASERQVSDRISSVRCFIPRTGRQGSLHSRTLVPAEKTPELSPVVAFYGFLIANLLAAVFSPIQDCDEVFNYWEPSHYLNHGYGLQTWEYSPDYAIRSWAYSGLHSVLIWIGLLPFTFTTYGSSKVSEFYFLRALLAVTCAYCEARLFSRIARNINPRVAIFFMIAMIISPGMYHAAPSYLPSTFAMYTSMLGFTAFMDWSEGIKTSQGIFWFGVGTVLGWPFAGALVLPFILEEVILAFTTGEVINSFRRLLNGALMSIAVLLVQTAIDSFFYKKLVCVPLNIVLYNVFSGGSRGPDIYGVEPWHFYVRNLALNFNVWFFLALAAFPLLLVQHVFFQKSVSKQTLLRSTVFVSPFYLWLAIFTAQPHKEERFMYPIYPALCLNAALSLHVLLANFGSTDPKHLVSKIPPKLKLAIVTIPLLLSFNIGFFRAVGKFSNSTNYQPSDDHSLGTITAYSAPLSVYDPLHKAGVAIPGDNVCLGKEWYRFPSSFNLPHGVHAKFIKSEFAGLLPGEFSESAENSGLFAGTSIMPEGMNDENREDPGKYVSLQHVPRTLDITLTKARPALINAHSLWTLASLRLRRPL